VHEGGRGDEADGEALLAGGQAKPEGHMRLAGAARSRVIMPVTIVTTARSTIGITLFAVKLSSSRRGRGMAAPST
jgi:hypothetical protein